MCKLAFQTLPTSVVKMDDDILMQPGVLEEMFRVFSYSVAVLSADFMLLLVTSYHPGVNILMYLPIMLICWETGFETWEQLREIPVALALGATNERILGDALSMWVVEVPWLILMDITKFPQRDNSRGTHDVDLKQFVDSNEPVQAIFCLFLIYVVQFSFFRFLSNVIVFVARVRRWDRLGR